jgi:phasin family protein
MRKVPEDLNELNRKAAETAMKLGQLSFEQGERLLRLQLEAVRGMLDDGLRAAKALGEARDPQQWTALQERNMRDMLSRIAEYSRSVQELAGKTQQEIGGAVESRLQAINAQFEAMVDEMAKSAPPGSEAGFAAMKQSLAAARAMADTMNKTTQQFVQSAQSAIQVAADAAGEGGKSGG